MVIPLKFKPLIESLEYYKLFDQKYIVTFIDEDRNYIDIGGCKLTIKNYQQDDPVFYTQYEYGLVAPIMDNEWDNLTDEEKIERYFIAWYGDKFPYSIVDYDVVTEFCDFNKIDTDVVINHLKKMTSGRE